MTGSTWTSSTCARRRWTNGSPTTTPQRRLLARGHGLRRAHRRSRRLRDHHPEYNHGYPSSLKHALDSVSKSGTSSLWRSCPYGGISGGLRAAEQLKAVFGELRMHDIREAVVLPMVFGKFDDEGNPTDPTMNDAATNVLTELEWWAQALSTARATTPFRCERAPSRLLVRPPVSLDVVERRMVAGCRPAAAAGHPLARAVVGPAQRRP